MRTLALVGFLALMSACSSNECAIEDAVGAKVAADVDDCGTFGLDESEAAYATARGCVLDHVAAGTAFRVQWTRMGTDSHVVWALARSGDSLYSFHYDGDPGGGGGDDHPITNTYLCSDVAPVDGCSGELCLACTGESLLDRCDSDG